MPTKTIRSEQEMTTVAEEVLSVLPQKNTAHVLALSGELGAGKTALVRALARQLGVADHITSPTFVVMKKYQVPKNHLAKQLVHIDAYRVEDVAEMQVLRLSELFKQEQTIVCVEWPERIEEMLPKDALPIHIDIGNGEQRTITYS